MDLIPLKVVLGQVCAPHSVFAFKYRKIDGAVGQKERLSLRNVPGGVMGDRRLMNRSGQLRLKDLDTGQSLDLYIDLLMEFNHQKINFLT